MKRLKKIPLDNYFTLVIAGGLYFCLLLYDPSAARAAFMRGLSELKGLIVPITFAIMTGGLASVLIRRRLPELFSDGGCLFSACATGSLLPPCPFIAWPIASSLREAGLSAAGTLVVLSAASTVEFFQLFAGLAIFGTKIVAIRTSFAFASVLISGSVLLLFKPIVNLSNLFPE